MGNSIPGSSPLSSSSSSSATTKAITVVAVAVAAALAVSTLTSFSSHSLHSDRKKKENELAAREREMTVTEVITVVAIACVAAFALSKLISSSLSPSSHLNVGLNQIPNGLRPHFIYPKQQGIIKIMCYNIWSLEEYKIQERMEAISQLILQHSPDIILLQEVTPSVYKFFQTCNWWRTYQCSVQPKKAARHFFCMQLSRLHVKKFFCKHLQNTTTGRGLYFARIKVGPPNNKKKLTVATCHLKSGTDSDMYITERVGNAKEAISLLHSEANIVFGGDMNWNEISDGSFPLLDDWCDAWSVLRPNENGWTYDTRTNRMMRHSRLRMSRLDRFFCKMDDFQMDSIERIGMEEIPGVFYEHKHKMLPVLPSDHYGLLLTISLKK